MKPIGPNDPPFKHRPETEGEDDGAFDMVLPGGKRLRCKPGGTPTPRLKDPLDCEGYGDPPEKKARDG